MLTFSSEYVKEYGQGSLFKQRQNAVVTQPIDGIGYRLESDESFIQ